MLDMTAACRSGPQGSPQRAAQRTPNCCTQWCHFCQPEIQNLGVATPGYEQIRGLDVSMNDAFDVGGIERVSNVDGNGDNTSVSRERAAIR